MRHYYGYTSSGKLWWTFVHTGGFPAGCDLDDPTCTDPLVVHLLANYNVNQVSTETLQGIVSYDCPCGPSVGICDCPPTTRAASYYDGTLLTPRPLVNVLIDSTIVSNNDNLTRYPSQLFTIKIQAVTPSEIPDGSTATVVSEILLEDGSETLTFTNGVTNEVALRAPAQGIKAHLFVEGDLVCPFRVFIKGFATT